MQTLILCCSHRNNSNSLKVGQIAHELAIKNHPNNVVNLIDLHANPVPLWDEEAWNDNSGYKQKYQHLTTAAIQANSIIMVVPEYAGMATPIAKNALLLLDGSSVAHKPALMVSVSAGAGGTYPIAELRMSSYKNNRLLWIPDHVIVRYADSFIEPFKGEAQQAFKRLDYSIKLLHEYTLALNIVRESGILAEQPFPFGA